MQLKENELFANRYLLERLLGRGGFAEVWLVTDKLTALKVALKIYAPGAGMDDLGVKVFSTEFSIVFNLNHNNLLKPSYFDTFDQMPYLVLPYCEAGSIARLIGVIREPEAWRIMRDIASGLAYLHEQEPPVIHQDIKPDNVMIGPSGKYLLTDFGISIKARNTLRKSLLSTGVSIGTLAYMGPERFSKYPLPIKASDIFSLGVTMYELLTGIAPFGEHGGLLLQQGAEIPAIEGNWSPEIITMIERCLEKETWERPTATEIKLYCEQYLRGKKPLALPEEKERTAPDVADAGKPGQANRQVPPDKTDTAGKRGVWGLWALLGLLGLLAATLAAVVYFVLYNKHSMEQQQQQETEQAKQRIEKLYNDFALFVFTGDNLVLRGDTTDDDGFELFYVDAVNCYNSALEYKETYAIGFSDFPAINVLSKKKVAEHKIDSVFFVFAEYAKILEEMEKEKPRKEQNFELILHYYQRADKLKPDSDFVKNFYLRHELANRNTTIK
jgi:hypothetical protein